MHDRGVMSIEETANRKKGEGCFGVVAKPPPELVSRGGNGLRSIPTADLIACDAILSANVIDDAE